MPEDRRLLLALAAVLPFVFALVSTNVLANHDPTPHNVPVGVIGSQPVADSVAASLARSDPGAYAVAQYASLKAGRTAILRRTVYGSYQPGPAPTLLLASAASPAVAALLQQSFSAVARRHHHQLIVRDVMPLPESDSRGATTFSAILVLIFSATAGSTLVFMLGRHRSPAVRLAALVGLGVGVGLITALVTQVVIGAITGHFLAVWGVAALYVLALALPFAGFQALLGVSGTFVGLAMFLVIGNPASGGGSAPELLPAGLRQLSQLLPPGAATTAMRDAVYFHGHGMTDALIVLGTYAVVGATLALVAGTIKARGISVTPPEPVAATGRSLSRVPLRPSSAASSDCRSS
jgi:hypothetical protein